MWPSSWLQLLVWSLQNQFDKKLKSVTEPLFGGEMATMCLFVCYICLLTGRDKCGVLLHKCCQQGTSTVTALRPSYWREQVEPSSGICGSGAQGSGLPKCRGCSGSSLQDDLRSRCGLPATLHGSLAVSRGPCIQTRRICNCSFHPAVSQLAEPTVMSGMWNLRFFLDFPFL